MKKKGKKTSKPIPKRSGYDRFSDFFEQYQRALFGLSMLLSVLMCFFMFEVDVSQSGDDSDYLTMADDFWHHFTFPGSHGPLYSIVISPVIGILGMKLILVKSLSAIFILLALWLFYKSFRGKVPAVILMPTLLLTSICSYLFFYASYTYSEPLFMLVQGLFFYFFSKYFLTEEEVSHSLKKDWRKYLILAGLALGMSLARSIGYGVLGAVILFFAIRLRWKDLLYMLAASVLVFVSFKVLKSLVWQGSGEAYAFTSLLAKDAYNPALGMEDFPGLVRRLIDNSQTYLSSCLAQFLGIIGERPSTHIAVNSVRTILIYILYALSMAVLFKRNQTLLFTGLYVGVMLFATFIVIQAMWAQDRLVVIYYPFILLFLLGGICYLFRIGILRKGFLVYPAIIAVLCFGTLSITIPRVKRNLPILQEKLTGNPFYGWTPDWENYIRGIQWADRNLEKDVMILSRKPSVSRVYAGGRRFTGFYPLIDTKDVLEGLSYEGRTLVVVAMKGQTLQGEPLRYVVNTTAQFTIDGTQAQGACVYAFQNEDLDQALQLFEKEQIKYTLDYNAFLEQCKALDNIRVYDPDKMCQQLEDSKVDYILLPQIRMDPMRKIDGMFINNIHRFVWFVSYKYPNRFQLIHTVGKDEPCEIVKFIRQ
ncbi:MAG: hypothetical protein LBP98_09415 [Tannerella sp.]|jgi:hypothetical protein|nr:hypothetical protein [Tannerella sp.]